MANPSGNPENGLLFEKCIDLISLRYSGQDLPGLSRSTPEYALPVVFKS